MDFIKIRGAREHNLKEVSIDIPRNQLTVITGVSGSGKSSLAFDTIYAEGQRRYVESLSAYARQFLELMQKPDVDSIEGLSPAISIEQKTTSRNPRSTVGTVTEIYDYLRLLFARVGIPYSPATGLPIEAQTVSQMVDKILLLPEGSKILLLSPVARGKKGEFKKEIDLLKKKGFQRIKVDSVVYDLDEVPELNKNQKHTLEVVVDRLVVKPDIAVRLADSIEKALELSEGLLYIEDVDTKESHTFSAKFSCPESGFTIDEIEPRLFSFNNPFGACPDCNGLGEKIVFDLRKIIPDPTLCILDGAIAPWASSTANYYPAMLEAVVSHYGCDPRAEFKSLPLDVQKAILYGSGSEKIKISFKGSYSQYSSNKPFEGVIPNLERRWKEASDPFGRDDLTNYQTSKNCETCNGHRLKKEALAVKIAGLHISEITMMSILESHTWACNLEQHLSEKQKSIAVRVLKEIRERLGFLVNVGLDYLTLSRASGTLSGGESQRIRLASQIGSGLTGVLYVLDEPSIGLHQRDNDRLLETLKNLRDLGNTVLVVEHDEDAIRTADFLIDMGPKAGRFGGEIVAFGTPEEVFKNPESLTGKYMSKALAIDIPKTRRQGNGHYLELKGATLNNLKNVDLKIPLGTFSCITGVSGGGKSSLVIETLYKALHKALSRTSDQPGPYTELLGIENVDKVIDIDQSPIGRTPRSNPVTYIGAFTAIREWFAMLPESKARGYAPGRFSFNVRGGRCEACEGDGVIKIEMHFLPDVYVTCDQCKGRRYNRETLDVKYKDKSISDILDMTVEEGIEFFYHVPSLKSKLQMLMDVGLEYIHIGQRATTLSGGEAQRIKLSKELARRSTGKTVYILDEPTTGLHVHDVKKLLEVLQRLVDQGNTVIVIEHNLDVIKTADYIVDIGPDGGHKGGEIVACGTPEDVMKEKRSYTGHYLKAMS